ncbi:RNA polymerase sigma-70 factor [Dyadobacter sp. CY312]|uniref:RNA polymerase sigma-70 factor n=1 Tax=Dyadobacter sp. CY312 TaxID=2907303 RepID=UPI001F264622|nr:RNA polymerase sigma-70 factor [Dyadobacter sp. CY312]MCE7042827.1 RNA polymerase sigma-70 factor [Dyadobacter sp. CY312]
MEPNILTKIGQVECFEHIDKQEFEAIYRHYWRLLYDFAFVKTHDQHVAEEIVQDLFASLWEKRDSLHISNLRSYLFTAVRNRVIDYYKQKVFLDLDAVERSDETSYPIFLDELETALQNGITGLPDKTREIFLLNRMEGKTASQISACLHVPVRTVEYHITQALRSLKFQLKDFTLLLLLVFEM